MVNLLVTVFVVQLVIYLVNMIGASTINDLLWRLYTSLPYHLSAEVKSQNALRREVLLLKRELAATSPQDEFAKWARIQRQHDKARATYDEKAAKLSSTKAKFDSTATVIRWLGTSGLRFFLQFWYAKAPVFYLPEQWFPLYVEWLLGFPRAPWGSVSIQAWGMACLTAITLVGEVIEMMFGWIAQRQAEKGKQRRDKMKMAMEGNDAGGEKKSQDT